MGTCPASSLPTRFVACPAAGSTSDALAERVLFFLGAVGKCEGYVPAYLDAFRQEVPSDQHYAVNYLHWGFDKPLLSASEARAMEDRDFPRVADMPGAPAIPGGTGWTPGPDGRIVAIGPVASAASKSAGMGACNLPLSAADAASQDGMAGVGGGCAWLARSVGAEASEGAGVPAAAARPAHVAGASEVGGCGIPLSEMDADEQAFWKDEGACDEMRAEFEAGG